jgi:hypothetical protein
MNGSVRSSAGLVWRHQRLVWWIFAVNLLLAWLASLPARATLSAVLDHSLESARLVNGFDVGALALLLFRPDVPTAALAPSAVGAAVVFLVYLLFLDGGIFAVYLDDRKLSRAEFFENSGLFFWRMLRLALYSLVPFAIAAAVNGGLAGWAGKLSSDAPQERLGFFVNLSGKLLFLLLALFARLWFDLAQARVVQDNERKLLRTIWRSLALVFRSGALFASYLGIALFSIVIFTAGVGLWVYLPHRATLASFLLLELLTLTMIATRLWMKAASARWVALLPRGLALAPVALPVEETPAPTHPTPVEVIEVTDVQPLSPEPPISE